VSRPREVFVYAGDEPVAWSERDRICYNLSTATDHIRFLVEVITHEWLEWLLLYKLKVKGYLEGVIEGLVWEAW